uniref:UDP-GlcNAc:betaGal beta-1,3-N-acetylglucosaminyltransferase-like protein 1 isoform X2 n=1 Tax=Petromyzon marinus TaxID=7757 RepID=A0AAJ7TGX8_PETMA|nr:UDP-GlcNAc:betaGal beta-1,3-N-acetylglucosaminyltransferase-like protein 1 isoform X2 [Petromyzon marinus]
MSEACESNRTAEEPGAPAQMPDDPGGAKGHPVDVSVILPVHNAACWLDDCLQGLMAQDFEGSMELSAFDDASTDSSLCILESWREKLKKRGILVLVRGHKSSQPKGVGFSKNQAIAQSSGCHLCFQDADDVMMPERIRLQYEAAQNHPGAVIGCQVRREPEDSTERYTRWINGLSQEQLLTQAFTSHGPTVIMPTWFCHRDLFNAIGNFDEGGKGVPEDLLFFYQLLRLGNRPLRVDQCLLTYRYHRTAATHSVLEGTIWDLRVRFLEERVLAQWQRFTIWNAGKQGRKLYRSLGVHSRHKVEAFCDVDIKKIKKGFYTYEESQELKKPIIPIKHFSAATPPFIICVKMDLTSGLFEKNLESLHLTEGVHFYHFN